MPTNPLDEFVQLVPLEDGEESSLGDHLNDSFEALEKAANISLRWNRLPWDSTISYKLSDATYYSNSFWVSLSGNGNINVQPGTNPAVWRLLGGTGDMQKATYDTNNSGVVDNAEALGGQTLAQVRDRSTQTGTQTANTISDFNAAVRTNRLDQMANPTADVSLNGQKLTNVGAPVLSTDGARKADVDAARNGLSIKDPVRVATTANITLSGTQTIDGVALVVGDRVLVKNQTTASQNGIYVVAAGAWSRSTDADTSAEVRGGTATWVDEGTLNVDKRFVLTTNNPITLDTTNLTFTQDTASGGVSSVNNQTGTVVLTASNIDSNNPTDVGAVTSIQTTLNSLYDNFSFLTTKAPVRATTTANITLSGIQTIDGVALVAGDRVLVKDQSTGSQNGIYVVATGAWARSIDANGMGKLVSGTEVRVTEGTAYADKVFSLITNNPITFGTTALVFAPDATGMGGGNTIPIAQTAHGLVVGNLVRSSGSAGQFVKAQADTDQNSQVVGVVTTVADANNFTLGLSGATVTLSGLTTGEGYYLDATTSGGYTATKPTAAGQVQRFVLRAISTTQAIYEARTGILVVVGNPPNIVTVTATSNIVATTDVLEVNAGATATTQTLPATFAGKFGRITIKQLGTGTITVAAASGTTLEAGTITTQGTSLDYYLSGTVWRKI